MKPFLSLVLAVVLIAAGCSGQRNRESGIPPGTVPGKINPSASCLSDTTVKYSLYLPEAFKPKTKYAVMILFDPHGSGALPLEKYKSLADRYQMILIGSNTSRNGQSFDQGLQIAETLIRDARKRFGADSSSLFLAGFSGGARVAGNAGMYSAPARGVIGCGAGLSGADRRPLYSFPYFGIVGNGDFNLAEMAGQAGDMERAGWQHALLIFDGIHAWPPADIMEKGILWFAGEFRLGDPSEAELAQYNIPKEMERRQELIGAFSSKDTLWWKREIRSLRQELTTGTSRTDTLIARRLVQFLGVAVYSMATSQLNQAQYDQALNTLTIYRDLEPENPAVDSLFRIYHQRTH